MKLKQQLMATAIAGTIAFTGSAFAMTKAEIQTENEKIETQLKSAKAQCDTLSGNAKDICVVEAKGAHSIAKAELEARENNTPKTQYNILVAKAEAVYAVANEKCDDLSGNAKDVCVKDAKAVLTTAEADAKADKKVIDAKSTASEKVGEARVGAAEEKQDANYAAAKERCDKYAGEAKENCTKDAKTKFGVK